MSGTHLFNPEGLPPAIGFSYGALSGSGRLLQIAGMIGQNPDMTIPDDLVDQLAVALRGVARVIADAGGEPSDLTSMIIYTTRVAEYRERLGQIGAVYREVFGKHFPPMALIGISELFEPEAKVELVCTAVIGEG